MKVKDIMEPLKRWLTPEMTVRDAIQTMKTTTRRHGLSINGIVVLDGTMKLVGIVSNKDLLRELIPSHVYFEESHSAVDWEEIRAQKTAAARNTQVSRIMTEDVRTVSVDDPLLRCADTMLTEQVQRLPVIRSDGKVVGIIYFRDVYNALAEMLAN